MYRVTTPTHTFKLPINTSQCSEIQVTYKQDNVKIVKHYENNTLPSGMSLDGTNVIILLTQEETKKFRSGDKVEAQVRVLTTGGRVYASRRFYVDVEKVLSEDILS